MSTQLDQDGLSRRELFPRVAGVAALAAAGLIGYELPHENSSAETSGHSLQNTSPTATAGTGVRSFVTRPDLKPPEVRITPAPGPPAQASTPRFVFVAPTNYLAGGPAQPGLMILDREGRLVWFAPVTAGKPFDFAVQSDRGKPVLTWWQGRVLSAHGLGVGQIANSTYRTIGSVRAGDGLMADLHELSLTSAGTALVTAYEETTTDLSSLGGPRRGKVFAGHAQEIDLATGKVLFDWNSLDHIGVEESYQPRPRSSGVFDYFHINSVAETDDGNLLISGRNTWTLYKVERSSGRVLWRLNGKRSDFSLSAPARFYWQHDARTHGSDTITVFDNAGPRKEKRSRALRLSVDSRAMRVDLTRAYVHPAGFLSNTLGSVQLLPDGRVFVGWGDQPYFSEFAPDGALLLDGQLPAGVRSYRAFLADWVGHPTDPPRVAAHANPAGGFIVYTSWNGATEIATWTVLAGPDRNTLTPAGSQPWTGFETAIAVNAIGPCFCAIALDEHGKEIGRSHIV